MSDTGVPDTSATPRGVHSRPAGGQLDPTEGAGQKCAPPTSDRRMAPPPASFPGPAAAGRPDAGGTEKWGIKGWHLAQAAQRASSRWRPRLTRKRGAQARTSDSSDTRRPLATSTIPEAPLRPAGWRGGFGCVRAGARGCACAKGCHRKCAGHGGGVAYFVAVRPVCGVVKGQRAQIGRLRCSARCTAAGRGVAQVRAPAWWPPRAPAGVDGAPVGTVEHFGGAQSSAPPPSTTRKGGRLAGGRRASRAARLGFTRSIGAGGSSWAAP